MASTSLDSTISRKRHMMKSLKLLVLAAPPTPHLFSAGFAPSSITAFSRSQRATELRSESQQQPSSSSLISTREGIPNLTGALENCELHEFILKDHKPLGCSVEESLASEPDGKHFVFVSELSDGGNAQKAGIQVGDVVFQLSGTFDELVDATGMGFSKVRSLIVARLKEDPLTIRVARGSDVLERHETALVDLCVLGEDDETVECINNINSYENMYFDGDDDEAVECQVDDETECMINSMWETWTEGLPMPKVEGDDDNVEEPKEEKKKVAPWASRSSGSGTYVRDPSTGKLVNIDE